VPSTSKEVPILPRDQNFEGKNQNENRKEIE
jgi:hypothetical protein